MANRVFNRMQRNASPQYYNDAAAIIAADAQVRSAAITEQYRAMSDSIGMVVGGAVNAVASYYDYSVKRESALQAREAFTHKVEMDRITTESQMVMNRIKEQEASTQLEIAKLDLKNKQLDSVAGPITAQIANALPALASEILKSSDPLDADKALGDLRTKIQTQYLNAEETRNPGVTARAWANPTLASAWNTVQGRILSRLEGTVLTDPDTGRVFSLRTLQNALTDSNTDPDIAMSAIAASQRDPNASQFKSLQEMAVNARTRLGNSSDPAVSRAVLLDEVKRKSPEVYAQYRQNLTNGFSPADALSRMKAQHDEFQEQLSIATGKTKLGGGPIGPPPAGMPPGAAVTYQRAKATADSMWQTAVGKVSRNDLYQTDVTKAEITGVLGGYRRVYEDTVRRMMSSGSKAAYDAAKADLDAVVADPTGNKVWSLLKTNLSVEQTNPKSSLVELVNNKELPTLGVDPKFISQNVSNFGTGGNKVWDWQPTDSAIRQGGYSSVAEMVLATWQASGWKPLDQTLQEFKDDGFITQSGIKPRSSASGLPLKAVATPVSSAGTTTSLLPTPAAPGALPPKPGGR